MSRQDLQSLVPGTVVIVGIPADAITSNQARITSWQVTQVNERLSYTPVASPLKNRRAAKVLGQQLFPEITHWRRLDNALYLGIEAGVPRPPDAS